MIEHRTERRKTFINSFTERETETDTDREAEEKIEKKTHIQSGD